MELFNTQVAVENLGPLLAGLLITIELTFVVIILSLGFALLVALGGMSRWPLLRWPIKAYIEIMRGTPLLLQLIYIYYVLPEVGIRLNAFVAGVRRAVRLNYSAYISEVYRGGILAVPKGQHDAAAALGMTRVLAMRRIVLPQAIRIVIPTLGNYFISLFKDTALCSVVSIQEVRVHRADPCCAQFPVFHAVYRRRGDVFPGELPGGAVGGLAGATHA